MAQVEGAVVGAGTVLNREQMEAAKRAGARFAVSPGLTETVARAAEELAIPLLPGVATAGDLMRGLDLGLTQFKFFPAMAAGGVLALKALTGPFGQARFCPTGGVTLANAPEWLALDQVLCVGGTWLVAKGEPDVEAIQLAAEQAAGLRSG
jgi:2-dehydro-3-deoxyphosphogluconate aldolase / (4S)-4-hydroxy-2-oxoglutarate aldolase